MRCTPRIAMAPATPTGACCSGVFVTALYTFRMMFMTFHGPERLDHHTQEHFHDVGWDMKGPLVALAIPSLLIGWFTVEPVLFGGYFGDAIRVLPATTWWRSSGASGAGPLDFALHAFAVAAGVPGRARGAHRLGVRAQAPAVGRCSCASASGLLYRILVNKYYFDWFNEHVIAPLARGLGVLLWRGGDQMLIDGAVVNGSAEHGRLARGRDAPAAERLSVLVRVLDDHRPGGAAGLVLLRPYLTANGR